MTQRCYNDHKDDFANYGARGITVCDEWLHSPITFIMWGLSHGWQKGLEIDRKDNDKEYSPDNCHFVTKKQNCRNRRVTKFIPISGVSKPLAEWAEIYGIKYITLYARIFHYGWSPERAVEDALYSSNRSSHASNS